MNPNIIELGPISITWYAAFIVTAMLIGILVAKKELKYHELKEKLFLDLAFYLIIFSMIGARLWYVAFEWENYKDNLLSIFMVTEGGLAIHGGILFGAIFIIYYTRKHKIKTLLLTDIAVPSLLLGQAIGRWGNFMNQEAHGGETTREFLSSTIHLPNFIVDGMNIGGTYYQPTFLYESIWNLIGFALIILILRKKWRFDYGKLTSFYLIWYGIIRIFIEQMRTDALLLGPIRIAQLSSFLMVIGGIVLFVYVSKKRGRNV